MSITVNLANQLTSPGGYLNQAYEKARSEETKDPKKKEDPRAHAVKEPEPEFDHNLGKAQWLNNKDDAVVVSISKQRAEEYTAPPGPEEVKTEVEEMPEEVPSQMSKPVENPPPENEKPVEETPPPVNQSMEPVPRQTYKSIDDQKTDEENLPEERPSTDVEA